MTDPIPPLAVWSNMDDRDEDAWTVHLMLDKVQAFLFINALVKGGAVMDELGHADLAGAIAAMAERFLDVYDEIGGCQSGIDLLRKRKGLPSGENQ